MRTYVFHAQILRRTGKQGPILLHPIEALNIKRPFGMRKDKSPMQETADKKPLSQAFADTATQRQIENDGTHSPSYRTREEEIPRRRNAEETKKRILAAAKELFSQKSYKQVGTRDIAALAEVNVTLIHRYFESKKKLFSEVLMTLGDNVEHAELSRQRARNHIADYFGAGVENRMKELRLILLSATDEEVSDVVSDFYVERFQNVQGLLPGTHVKEKTFLLFSLLAGISLSTSFLKNENMRELDTDYLKRCLDEALEKIYS